MDEFICNSVEYLLSLLPEVSNDHLFFYRGHSDKEYNLRPSIYREKRWFSNEDKLMREIILRCPNEFSSMSTAFEKLVKMQHYDLPTRLLDLTENPLVALFFSCVGVPEIDKDGEMLFFKIGKSEIKYFDSDTVSVISNIAWAKPDFEIQKQYTQSSKEFHNDANIHALRLMHDIRQEKPHFSERINPSHLSSVVCVKPKLDNPRVIRQDGAFLLFGINKNKFEPASILDEWRLFPDSKRIIIKAKDKRSILTELMRIGISKAKLFPEIDMVSQFIKNDFGLTEEEFKSSAQIFSPLNIKTVWGR